MPAHVVVPAQPHFEAELDAALTAHFEDPLVGHGIEEIGLHVGVGLVRDDRGHAGTAAQQRDGLIPYRGVHFAQLGLRLGVVQQHLGIAEDRQRIPARGLRQHVVGIVVDRPLDRMVARAGHLPVGRIEPFAAADLHLVGRADDRLRHAGVTAVELADEVDGLVTVDVGERRAPGREVGVHELLGHGDLGTVGRRIVVPAGLVERRELLAVLTAEDHLLREQPGAGEERAVGGLHIARDERIGSLVHDLLGGGSGLAQEFVVGVILGLPRFVGRRLARVVLAEGAFIEADARLEGQCHPLVDERRAFREFGVGEAVGACEGEVFQHFVHDVLAAVSGFHHRFLVAGRDREVVPGHGAEGLHLVVVEPGAPETGDALVVVVDLVAHTPLALVHIVEHVVHAAKVRPVALGPSGLVVGRDVAVGAQ